MTRSWWKINLSSHITVRLLTSVIILNHWCFDYVPSCLNGGNPMMCSYLIFSGMRFWTNVVKFFLWSYNFLPLPASVLLYQITARSKHFPRFCLVNLLHWVKRFFFTWLPFRLTKKETWEGWSTMFHENLVRQRK